MYLSVYNHLKVSINVICYLRISLLYLQRERSYSMKSAMLCHPCFYGSPDRTNRALPLERAAALSYFLCSGAKIRSGERALRAEGKRGRAVLTSPTRRADY